MRNKTIKTLTLKVSGMTCNGCANAVQAALTRIEGVRRADVSLEQKRARLVLEDTGSVDDLVSAVRAAGYDASLES